MDYPTGDGTSAVYPHGIDDAGERSSTFTQNERNHLTAIRKLVEMVLVAEGAGPGNSLHSWRCEHPDRYGECGCVEETSREIVGALLDNKMIGTRPQLSAAHASGWSEAHDMLCDLGPACSAHQPPVPTS